MTELAKAMIRFEECFGPAIKWGEYQAWIDGTAAPSQDDLRNLAYTVLENLDYFVFFPDIRGAARKIELDDICTNSYRIGKDPAIVVEKSLPYSVEELIERTNVCLDLARQARSELGQRSPEYYRYLQDPSKDKLSILVLDDEESWVSELLEAIQDFPDLEVVRVCSTNETAKWYIECDKPEGVIMSGLSNGELSTEIVDCVAELPIQDRPEIKVGFHYGGRTMDNIFGRLPQEGRKIKTFNFIDNEYENHYSYLLYDFYSIAENTVTLPRLGKSRIIKFQEIVDGAPREIPFLQFFWKYIGYRARRFRMEEVDETLAELFEPDKHREFRGADESKIEREKSGLLGFENGVNQDMEDLYNIIIPLYDMNGFRYILNAEQPELSQAMLLIDPHRYVEEYMENAPLYFDDVKKIQVEITYIRTLSNDKK